MDKVNYRATYPIMMLLLQLRIHYLDTSWTNGISVVLFAIILIYGLLKLGKEVKE